MARRRRRRRPPVARLLLGALLIAVIAAYAIVGPELRSWLGLAGDAPTPSKGDAIRVVTWNLRNFPGERQDLGLLRQRLRALDADVIAVQEIREPEALRALMPGWELHLSEGGGRGHQRLGVLFDPKRITAIGEGREHDALTFGGRVRPAYSIYLRAAGGPDFHLVVVHLKAMASGYSLRTKQWPELAAIASSLATSGPGEGDRDVILVGDFNATGAAGQDPAQELRALAEVLGAAGLRRIDAADGCSAYWDGPRRDAWQEPSLLDLIWVGDLRESVSASAQTLALGHCGRHHCAAFRSTAAYPDLDFAQISDHCPVVLDLAAADDDP